MGVGRDIPAVMKRLLRQESGFGCAECGCPVIEYHHIIEFSVCKKHEIDNIAVLCPNHHSMLAKGPEEYVRKVKANPFNLRSGVFSARLWSGITARVIDFGIARIKNARPAVKFFGNTLLDVFDSDGFATINLEIPGPNLFPRLRILENEILTNVGDYWDIEFRTNFLRVVSKDQGEHIVLDLRGEYLIVRVNIKIGAATVILGEDKSSIGGLSFSGRPTLEANGIAAGIEIGQEGRIVIYPNYAMRYPKAELWAGERGRRAMVMVGAVSPLTY